MLDSTSASAVTPSAHWTREGLIQGARSVFPVLPGTLAFGMAFGALCAQMKFTLMEVQGFMGLVYGGMSQFVAVQAWPETLTATSIATLALLTLTVNIRFFLMSATFRSWFETLPAWQAYPPLLLITDAGWLLSLRYRERGGSDASYFLGGGLMLYAVWFVSALPGFLLAEQLANPKIYGLDLVFPAFFAAMLVPAWKGLATAVPWAVAGIVALTVQHFVGGWWFIIAGSIAGAVSAGLLGGGGDG